jgi:purine-binding chemotaxis protein CheW
MSPRRRKDAAVDWPSVRDALQRLHDADVAALSAEQTRAILEERARILSRPHTDSPVCDSLDVLTFAAGVERYAIATKYVREVMKLVHLTPVPGAPDFVVGVTNYRGQILSVLTPAIILGTRRSAITDLGRLIVLGDETPVFGVLADRTDAIASLHASEILPLSDFIASAARDYLLGVTRSAVLVIDGARLLHDPQLIVRQRETRPAQDAKEGPMPC